jgi:hypothetical protein
VGAPAVKGSPSLAEWCRSQGIAYRRGLDFIRRGLPCITLHRRHHIQLEAADEWLRAEARRQATGNVDLARLVDEIVAAVQGDA